MGTLEKVAEPLVLVVAVKVWTPVEVVTCSVV